MGHEPVDEPRRLGPGTDKATCGDRSRLVGATSGLRSLRRYAHTALCSDVALAAPGARDAGSVNAHSGGRDWVSGYTKLECAPNERSSA